MIKTVLVGYGWWGKHICERLQKGQKSFDLLGIVEPEAKMHSDISCRGITVFSTFEEGLGAKGVEAVILTSPNLLHDAQVSACIDRGLHVFCEKPLSLNAQNARRNVERCRENGLVLGVGHERRFEPAILKLKSMLDQGELGTIMHSELAFSHNKLVHLTAESWRTSKTHAPAAGMTQMGIHLTDLLIHFFGKVRTLHAITADRSLGWETGDILTVQLQFEAGMTATMQALLNTPHFLRTHVFGSDKWVEIRNSTHPDTPGGMARMEIYEDIDSIKSDVFDWTDSVMANLSAFGAAIKGQAPYPYSDFELCHNIEVLEAIIASAENNEAVHL